MMLCCLGIFFLIVNENNFMNTNMKLEESSCNCYATFY